MRIIKRAPLLLVALLLVPALGIASSRFEVTAEVEFGEPVGVVEIAAPCDPGDEINGFDGIWFDIAGFGGHNAVLGTSPLSDFDVHFYDADCAFIDDTSMAEEGLGQPEDSVVPDDAAFVVVNQFSGAGGRFTLILY
jgi:hypothetical protein